MTNFVQKIRVVMSRFSNHNVNSETIPLTLSVPRNYGTNDGYLRSGANGALRANS